MNLPSRSAKAALAVTALLGSMIYVSQPATASGQPVVETFATTTPLLGSPFPSSYVSPPNPGDPDDPTIIGGERNVVVTNTSITPQDSGVLFIVAGGVGAYSQGASQTGTTEITYDGRDGDALAFDPVGLGGLDLTAAAAFHLIGQADANPGGKLAVTVWTDASNCSAMELDIIPSVEVDYVFPFSSFTTSPGCTGAADFTSVGAISLLIDGTQAENLDFTIDFFEAITFDYGDLPATYAATTIADGGAAHIVTADFPGLLLGSEIDIEADGTPSTTATGDDVTGATDDEDGVVQTPGSQWTAGGVGSLDITVAGATFASLETNAVVNAWVDFNHDGDFDDPGEQALVGEVVINGTQTLVFSIPADADFSQPFNTRIRLFADSAADPIEVTPLGVVRGGEVEDHQFDISPDLSILKDDSLTDVDPGDETTYVLTISNSGNHAATGVTVSDVLPAGVTFVSASDGGTNADGVVTWPTFDLGIDQEVTRTVTVLVNSAQAAGVEGITNVASVSDDGVNGSDPTPDNNEASDDDVLNAAPDLSVAKSNGVDQVKPGDTVVYTIEVTNVGNQGATGIVLSDPVPAGTTFVGASDGGSLTSGVVSWPSFDLAVGETATRTVTLTVDAGTTGSVANTASAFDDGSNGSDPTPDNNADTDSDPVDVPQTPATTTDAPPVIAGVGEAKPATPVVVQPTFTG